MNPILSDATEAELIHAITYNEIDSWQKMYTRPKKRDPYHLFGVTGIITDVPYMMMQPLWDGDPRLTHVAVEEIITWYKQEHLPFMWFITPENPTDQLPTILQEVGLEEATMKVPGMAIDLVERETSEFENLADQHAIREVQSGDLGAMTEVMLKAFEVDELPELREGMKDFFTRTIRYDPSYHVVAEQDGNIVACASMIYAAGVAGVYNVSVLQKYRRQGIASSMMARLLLDAIDRGYQYSILHSSEKGKAVYEQLGYRTAFVYRRFLLRPEKVGLHG